MDWHIVLSVIVGIAIWKLFWFPVALVIVIIKEAMKH